METPRELARRWRRDPADRPRIERLIAVRGLQSCFRWVDGQLIARLTAADRERITASGGGAYRSAADRRFGQIMPETAASAGPGLSCTATLDGEPMSHAEAEMHRNLARRAA